MKIVFVIQKLAGLKGGAERVLCDTARALSARGHEVSIATYEARSGAPTYDLTGVAVRNLFPFARRRAAAREGTPGRTHHRPHGAERLIRALPNGFPLAAAKWHLTHGAFRRRLAAFLRRERPDVVVPFLRPAITAAAFAAQGTDMRVVASIHNVPERDYGDAARWDRNPIYKARSHEAFAHCDAITVLLEEFRDWFPADMQPRIHVIPNAVARLGPRLADGERERLVVGVGRLASVKRLDLLLRAWAQICRERPGWRLELHGDGEERGRLTALIDKLGITGQARLCGVTDAMGPLLDRAALLCHPAAFEGFGLAVAEALVHGVPVIGFADCPGVNTLIRDGVNGLLVEPGEDAVAALASALAMLTDDDARRLKLGAAAPDSMARYRPDAIIALWERVLAGR